MEKKSFEKIDKNEEKILSDYKAKYGNVINTDNFRQYFKDEGYKGYNAADVQEPSSYLAKKMFTQSLKNKGRYATFFAGGSGTGKTSAIKGLPVVSTIMDKSATVLDGNLSSYNSAIKKISEAVDAGKKTPIIYVYRDPKESFTEGVVKRMLNNVDEGGRLVPSKVVAENHIGSWKTAERLHKEGYPVRFIDNSFGKSGQKIVPYDEISKKVNYPSQEELTNALNNEAKKLYDNGKITELQYKGYTS